MSHVSDDPRLTAYALGELDDAERPEVEALLDADPEARALVEDVRATARLLAEQLRAEPAPGLAPEHHRAIETRLEPAPAPPSTLSPRRVWPRFAVAAALLGLAATLIFPLFRESRPGHAPGADAQGLAILASPRAQGTPTVDAPADRVARSDGTVAPPLRDLYGNDSAGAKPAAPADPTPALAFDSLGRRAEDGPPAERSFALGLNEEASRLAGRASQADAERGAHPPAKPSSASRSRYNFESTSPSGRPNTEGLAVAPSRPPVRTFAPAAPPAASLPDPSLSTAPQPTAGPAPAAAGITTYNGRRAEIASGVNAPEAEFESRTRRNHDLKREMKPEAEQLTPTLVKALKEKASKQDVYLESMHDVDKNALVDTKASRDGVAFPKTFREMAERRKQALADEAQAGGEVFAAIQDNPFLPVAENPRSTFSIDVDTASYANVRRFLNQNARPPKDAVRIEELVNYFPYRYAPPKPGEPFSVDCEVARCPWDAGHHLVRIALKGREIERDKRPPSNLVFLIDISGSMNDLDKLPLLKAGMKLLVDQLGENDRVAIVVYAGQEGLALPSTRCDRKAEILSSLEQLQAGGSTNGERGILLAYDLAVRNFIPGGTNRVILATDGDFNVGVTEGAELDKLIEAKRQTGVFLSVLGFGQGNVKHDKLEGLADKGNGQYCYIDSIKEARKVLVEQMGGTLVAIAKDVKIQVQFDPARASAYRLIGYENRVLQARDFEDDRKDAGEIGAGHCVTALYEVVPPGQGAVLARAEAPRDATPGDKRAAGLLEVRLRFKAPDGDVSRLVTHPVADDGRDFAAASADFRFASAVAGFGMLLRDSPHKGTLTWDGLIELTSGAVGDDPGGLRAEFLGLARKGQAVSAR